MFSGNAGPTNMAPLLFLRVRQNVRLVGEASGWPPEAMNAIKIGGH